jgi:hypothetical protein
VDKLLPDSVTIELLSDPVYLYTDGPPPLGSPVSLLPSPIKLPVKNEPETGPDTVSDPVILVDCI